MIAEASCGLGKSLGGDAAFDEIVDGSLGRAKAVGGLDGFRGLEFMAAIGNARDDAGVDGGDVATGNGGCFHYARFNRATDVVFRGGDVLHAYGDGPAVGGRFEVPLGGGEAFGGVEDVFFCGFEIGEGFSFFILGDFLSASGEREGERTD